ncbi:ubiquinol-cytochrome C chaperone family protein [Pseudahrensia aquimaris]|uniref:Ubiquinol-cytochrome C chaperone family protein n=1 Tax=Pseudahrensia aquimaris TaxID=744461 RepID=A0ABW3FDV6_9HYPH
MFKALFKAFQGNQSPHALYGAVVAQSRQTVFFEHMGVPDTMNGRFEMMCIHVYLALRRMKREGVDNAQFNQDFFDIFIDDMEAGLREAGVGDTTVPKRIKKMSRIFYGQAKVWEEVDLENDSLSVAQKAELLLPMLQRNLYPDSDASPDLVLLSDYMVRAYDLLNSLHLATVKKGVDVFPPATLDKAA